MSKLSLAAAMLLFSSGSYSLDLHSQHHQLEAEDRILILTDRLHDLRRHREKFEKVLDGYRGSEGAIPGKQIQAAEHDVEDTKLSTSETEKELAIARLERDLWKKRAQGKSDKELLPLYDGLWKARAELYGAQADRADGEYQFEKENYRRLNELAQNHSVSPREAFEAFHRMKDAESDRELLRSRATAAVAARGQLAAR